MSLYVICAGLVLQVGGFLVCFAFISENANTGAARITILVSEFGLLLSFVGIAMKVTA